MPLKLGLVDQSPVRNGGTAADALRETLELARAAERLGYSRYWLAEHHSTNSFAGSAPEVLVPMVAAATRTMRVGSGGVLLPHYSPLHFLCAPNSVSQDLLCPDFSFYPVFSQYPTGSDETPPGCDSKRSSRSGYLTAMWNGSCTPDRLILQLEP